MNNSNKHITIISPSLKMGGIERALVVLANHFAYKGFQITFVSCLAGHYFYQLSPTIKFVEPNFKRKKSLVNAILFYPRLALFIRQQTKRANPDVVLAFGDWFSPLVLLALYGTKYPVYISDRTSPDYKFKFPIPQLKKLLYPQAAGFIAQTERAALYKKNQFGNRLRIKVIPNALREVKLYPEIRREKIILYVGRFAWEKGPDKLIRAFAQIENKQGWQLHMAGSGPLLIPMKKLANELGINNYVSFLGKVVDVDPIFARSSIFVLPSVLEGFPNSLCEAMAAGLPVVCFDSIPFEEIVSHNINGYVVKLGLDTNLAQSLAFFMKSEQERERLATAALNIKIRLSVEIIGNQVLEFIGLL